MGGLPISALHFVAPAILGLIGLFIGGGSVAGAIAMAEGNDGGQKIVGIVAGVLFSIAMLGTTFGLVRPALARRVRVALDVSPQSITADGGAPIERVAGETVTVERLSGGRGTYPMFALVYGNDLTSTRVGAWMSFNARSEIEPFAEMLRRRLHDVPLHS